MLPHLSWICSHCSIWKTKTHYLFSFNNRPFQIEESGGWCIHVLKSGEMCTDQRPIGSVERSLSFVLDRKSSWLCRSGCETDTYSGSLMSSSNCRTSLNVRLECILPGKTLICAFSISPHCVREGKSSYLDIQNIETI